ncbi:unnamed protein product [Agarophyton chilense]
MKEAFIFVYGTLRYEYTRLPKPQRRLDPPNALHTSGTYITTTKLNDYGLFDVGDYPAIIPRPGSVVVGDVFSIPDERIVQILDEYEGIGGLYERPYEYVRKSVQLAVMDRVLDVWVYVYNWQLQSSSWVRSGDYVAYYLSKLHSESLDKSI